VILTVTLNAAIDLTYTVDALIPHAVHRVRSVHSRAGGKGINVARVIAKLGHDVAVTGLSGGLIGAEIHSDLTVTGLRDELVTIKANSRRTVTVVAEGDATLFNEPGPVVLESEWDAFCGRFAHLAGDATVVVCSGSLPPGVPISAYALLCRIAHDCGTPAVVDAEGAALRAAVAARPDVVKPNAAELTKSVSSDDPGEAFTGVDTGRQLAGATTDPSCW
jgi:tagatose 6-phosphate kinase